MTERLRAEKRRAVPMEVQRDVALRQLIELMRETGRIPPEDTAPQLDLDHDPMLALRDVDPETRHHIPHQHAREALIFRYRPQHNVKTRGRGATTADSDIGNLRKTRQLVEARIKRGEVDPDDPSIAAWAPKAGKRPKPKRQWPKGRKLQSRNTFQDRKRDKR